MIPCEACKIPKNWNEESSQNWMKLNCVYGVSNSRLIIMPTLQLIVEVDLLQIFVNGGRWRKTKVQDTVAAARMKPCSSRCFCPLSLCTIRGPVQMKSDKNTDICWVRQKTFCMKWKFRMNVKLKSVLKLQEYENPYINQNSAHGTSWSANEIPPRIAHEDPEQSKRQSNKNQRFCSTSSEPHNE